MPMWMAPPLPPPPPPRKPRPSELSSQLLDAVWAGDIPAARKIFDTAFWEKVDFKPDSFHLLQAAQKGDRSMVSLLADYGADWTAEENKIAASLVKPGEWKKVEPALKAAGLRTQYSLTEQAAKDPATLVRWAHRSVEEAVKRGHKDAEEYRRELQASVSMALVTYVLGNDMDRAKEMLLYRDQKKGSGTPGDPLDIKTEYSFLLDKPILANGKNALLFIDRLQAAGFVIKPVEVDSIDLIIAKDIVHQLDRRGVLDKSSAGARRSIINDWTSLQRRIDFGGGFIHEIDENTLKQRNDSLRAAAKILFANGNGPTEREAEDYIRLHERRAGTHPEALANAERQLLELGFFESAAWTTDRLRRLAAAGTPLKDRFNGRAALREMRGVPLRKLLTAKTFPLLLDAHRGGLMKARAEDVTQILDWMKSELKKEEATPEMTAALKTLAEAGADFSQTNPNLYLGKTAPGLAKALLQSNAVTARQFDMKTVMAKNGGGIPLVIKPGEKGYAYNEFTCQLILERADALKYVPLRDDPAVSYQKQFVRAWVQELSLRSGGSVTYRKRPPTTPLPPKPKM